MLLGATEDVLALRDGGDQCAALACVDLTSRRAPSVR